MKYLLIVFIGIIILYNFWWANELNKRTTQNPTIQEYIINKAFSVLR